MRHLLVALLALGAAPAAAQGTYLQSSTLECAALEATVHYGLVDGSQEATASALTDLMGLNGGPACLAELVSYGYAAWTQESECRDAMELIRIEGARRRVGIEPQEIVVRVLTASDEDLCDRMKRRVNDYDDAADTSGGDTGGGTGEDTGGDVVN